MLSNVEKLLFQLDSFGSYVIYYMISSSYVTGIIDILQQYNTRKWGETMMRKAAGNQESQISCVDPVTYADRFVEFISSLLE